MLKKRLLTACVAIPLVWLAIFKVPAFSFSLIVLIFMLLAAHEWTLLVGVSSRLFKLFFSLAIILTCMLSAYFMWAACALLCLSLFVWLWLFIAVVTYNRSLNVCGIDSHVLRAVMGWIILSSGWLSFTILKINPHAGPIWLLYVCLVAWTVDSAAYFVGRAAGSTPLASRVSPKKTWEGLFGGMVAVLVLVIVAAFFLPGLSGHRLSFAMVSLLVALMSIFGDLSVSFLKRLAGVKDTGTFFPGHGGILDRIDSLLPALLIFALATVFFNLWST